MPVLTPVVAGETLTGARAKVAVEGAAQGPAEECDEGPIAACP